MTGSSLNITVVSIMVTGPGSTKEPPPFWEVEVIINPLSPIISGLEVFTASELVRPSTYMAQRLTLPEKQGLVSVPRGRSENWSNAQRPCRGPARGFTFNSINVSRLVRVMLRVQPSAKQHKPEAVVACARRIHDKFVMAWKIQQQRSGLRTTLQHASAISLLQPMQGNGSCSMVRVPCRGCLLTLVRKHNNRRSPHPVQTNCASCQLPC